MSSLVLAKAQGILHKYPRTHLASTYYLSKLVSYYVRYGGMRLLDPHPSAPVTNINTTSTPNLKKVLAERDVATSTHVTIISIN